MNIASVLSGFSLGDADLLRRAMGKKKPEEMAAQREKFLKGCEANRHPGPKAEKIFNLMEKFSGYGFNKSHSAAYAQISYQTAYLKAHYPLQFFGALITSDMDNTDKVLRYIHDCREAGIRVRPPDINASCKDFSIVEDQLLFGLGAIKNVGSAAIDSILETRDRLGRFSSLQHFCESVDMRTVNKRVMESLIKSGACDSLGVARAALLHGLPAAMDIGQAKQKDFELGQSSLLDLFDDEPAHAAEAGNGNIPEWSDHERLKFEKEAIGFYITGHPLDSYARDLAWFTDANSATIAEGSSPKSVNLAGIPIKVLPKTTRKGDKMAIVTLEDLQGSLEVIFWPELYAQVAQLLEDEVAVLIRGEVDAEGNLPKVIAQSVVPLAEARARCIFISAPPAWKKRPWCRCATSSPRTRAATRPSCIFCFPTVTFAR
jgi:DNA polymerase-3 subunit alpha